MDQPSIRSFFRPASAPKSHPPISPPAVTPQYLPPPPPVLKPSSYALPPSSLPSPNPQTQTAQLQTQSIPSSQSQNRNPLLPHQATISPIQPHHIPALKRINALLLPVAYPDSFYTNITDPTCSQSQFSRVIEWEGKVVGGVVCRVDGVELSRPGWGSNGGEDREIYIQSLALLSPFRGKGLAGVCLEEIIGVATTPQSSHTSTSNSNTDTNENENGTNNKIKGLYAHVWTQNTSALEWYNNHGFILATSAKDSGSGVNTAGVVPGYYRKLRPDTAVLLRRELSVKDYISHQKDTALPISTTSQTREVQAPLEKAKAQTNRGEQRPPLRQEGTQTRSFQDRGPEREWNDLPVDVVSNGSGNGLLGVKGNGSSGSSSRASSRGAEGGSGKGGRKKRVYPAAAFAG